jgi:hypothetical protein
MFNNQYPYLFTAQLIEFIHVFNLDRTLIITASQHLITQKLRPLFPGPYTAFVGRLKSQAETIR